MRFATPILLSILFISCEDPIIVEVPIGETKLVVEGVITDQMSSQQVRLSTTDDFLSSDPTPKVSNATIQIIDSNGNLFSFSESSTPGTYLSDSFFQGVINTSYKLQFFLDSGQPYESDFQELKPVPQIDALTFAESILLNSEGFIVTVETTDNLRTGDFYRWRIFKNDIELGTLSDVFLRSDRLFNGNPFNVEFDTFTFEPGDECTVEQLSLTESSFDFFRLVQIQTGDIGESTSTAPTEVIGNIRNINDPEEKVLGFFYATSITDRTVIIQ